MTLENAKRFLEQVLKDEALRASTAEKEPEEIIVTAKELGFDVTAEELDEAVRTMRQAAKEATKELSLDEMDKAAGGAFGQGDEAPDGHELGCVLPWHHFEWQEENQYWCQAHYFNENGVVM